MLIGKKIGILLIGLMIVMTGCADKVTEESESTAEAPTLLDPVSSKDAVSVIVAERMDLHDGDLIEAIVVPKTEQLYFTLSGEVKSIEVVAGQTVEKDEVLATISQERLEEQIETLREEISYIESSYDLQIRQAEVSLELEQKKLTAAQSQYEKQQKQQEQVQPQDSQTEVSTEKEESQVQSTEQNSQLQTDNEEGNVSEVSGKEITEYDLQLALLSVQEATLVCDQLKEEYNLEIIQREEELQALIGQLGEDQLLAPFSGRIIEVSVTVGSYVTKDDVIMTIVNEDEKLLKGEPFYNGTLKSVKNVEAIIDDELYPVSYMAYDDLEYARSVENDEMLPTWFRFENTEGLQFGDRAKVRFYVQYSKDAVVIPSGCVHKDEMGKYVYKEEEGKRLKTYVTVGVVTENYTEIQSGIKEGDKVYG